MGKRERGAELQRKAGETGPVSRSLSRLSRTSLLIVARFTQESRSPDASTTMRQLWGQARNVSQQARVRMCRSRGAQLFTWAVVKHYCCRSVFVCLFWTTRSWLAAENRRRCQGKWNKRINLGSASILLFESLLWSALTKSSAQVLSLYFQAPGQQSKSPAVER